MRPRAFHIMMAVTVLILGASRPTFAQMVDTPRHRAPTWNLGAFVGVGDRTTVREPDDPDPERQKILAGVHAVGTLMRFGRWSLAYAADVIPVLVVTNVPKFVAYIAPNTINFQTWQITGRGPAPGVALSPIGFESAVDLTKTWQAVIGGAVGAVWFARDVPVPLSRARNYTADYSASGRWQYRAGRFLSFGYMFHHLSNAGTALNNPGLNGHILTVGVSRTFGR